MVEAGLFDERFSHSEDYDLWLRLAVAGARLAYQKKVLLIRRELATGLCGNPVNLLRCQIRVLIKLLRAGGLTSHQRALARERIHQTRAAIRLEQARGCFGRGEFMRAAKAIQSANRVMHSTRLRMIAFGLRSFPHLLLRLHSCRHLCTRVKLT